MLYANDIVIFANRSKDLVRAISYTLSNYERWSGQKVSKAKSSIIFSKHIGIARHRASLSLLGFVEGTLSLNYLGVPIISGRLKAVHLEGIMGKIKAMIED